MPFGRIKLKWIKKKLRRNDLRYKNDSNQRVFLIICRNGLKDPVELKENKNTKIKIAYPENLILAQRIKLVYYIINAVLSTVVQRRNQMHKVDAVG